MKNVEEAERENNPGQKEISEDAYRAEMQAPLLVIYLLRGYERGERTFPKGYVHLPYRDDLVLPALGMHFPGGKDPDGPKNLVRYRLNRVAQAELFPSDVDDEDVADDVDSDDD